MSAEAKELHDLRVGQFMRASYESVAASKEQEPEPAEVSVWENTPTRQGLCLCCGERKAIPIHWHVCIGCHVELERKR